MDKKTQQILLIAGVGIVAYMIWKQRQETSSFSNVDAYDYAIGGRRATQKRKCEDIVVYDCPKRMGQPTHLITTSVGCTCPLDAV
mgnify:CR=1 FL=1